MRQKRVIIFAQNPGNPKTRVSIAACSKIKTPTPRPPRQPPVLLTPSTCPPKRPRCAAQDLESAIQHLLLQPTWLQDHSTGQVVATVTLPEATQLADLLLDP